MNVDRRIGGQSNRWNTQQLLTFTRKKDTFVWTPTFDDPRPFFVQVLFATTTDGSDGHTLVPALPFQAFSSARVKITISRYIDQFGSEIQESYIVNGYNPSPTEPAWLPVAIIVARKVTIVAELIDTAPGHTTQFVDVSVALVETIDTAQIIQSRYAPSVDGNAEFLPNIFGWGDVPTVVRTPQNAAAVQLLPADQTRRQFWVTNEGAARLALRFGSHDPIVAAGAEEWDVILDAKGGAVTRYESPVDAHWGEVRGIWEAGGAGFAMASGASIE